MMAHSFPCGNKRLLTSGGGRDCTGHLREGSALDILILLGREKVYLSPFGIVEVAVGVLTCVHVWFRMDSGDVQIFENIACEGYAGSTGGFHGR
jgi:hypothetical protein